MGKRKVKRPRDEDSEPRPAIIKYGAEETFADSEDRFFTGRDKILLEEGPAQKKQRRLDEEDQLLQPSDEEVLQYVDSATEEEGYQSNEQLSSAGDGASGSDVENGSEEDENNVHGWGSSKADYYNADVIETEADALEEEAEARRMQQKRMQSMAKEDFGFDEIQWKDETEEHNRGRKVVEKLPDVQISEQTSISDRLKILKNRYPEFEPLAKDFADLQTLHKDLQLAAEAAQAVIKHRVFPNESLKERASKAEQLVSPSVIKHRALSAYLGALAMYFALLSSPQKESKEGGVSAMPANDLREHAVMDMLLKCRQVWLMAKDMKDLEIMGKICDADEHVVNGKPGLVPVENAVRSRPPEQPKSKSITLVKRKYTLDVHATAALDDTVRLSSIRLEDSGTGKRKLRERRQNDIGTLLARIQTSNEDSEDQSDFGDETPLTAEQTAEKARRKKSLRFYSSQIVQKSNKRGGASRDAGGDDDLPRKERLRDRQARLQQQAEKRGREAPDLDTQLDNEDLDHASYTGSDDYYDMVAAKSKQKKFEKNALAEAYSEATKLGAEVHEEVIGPDGKRAITYAIEKNKGLMPRRKKDVRNPRVKKRKKYDERMKKLGSMRQVYKGGEGKGGYGGELTGIKANLVKSVKL